MKTPRTAAAAFGLAATMGVSSVALAQPGGGGGGDYGIEFVTVGNAGNRAFDRVDFDNWPNSPSVGRGRVDYDYRIGKYEITTGQWLEFANVVFPRADRNPFLSRFGPSFWGAFEDPAYSGPGFRFKLSSAPNSAMKPVYGISWREAAMYCNWLHNNKSTDPAALLSGAYDVSTWGDLPQGYFSDALTHEAGARFWIPTFDEQLKAMHYDPDRHGLGQGGWWLNKNMSDIALISGAPGVGQTSAGYDPGPFEDVRDIPLGAYADQTSAYGLYDTSGGTREWNERILLRGGPPYGERGMYGSYAGGSVNRDSIYSGVSTSPGSGSSPYGFRIASLVPAPGGSGALMLFGVVVFARRRRLP